MKQSQTMTGGRGALYLERCYFWVPHLSLVLFQSPDSVELVDGHFFLFHDESEELGSWTPWGSEGHLSLYSPP